jgi:hypothetical protein
MQEKKARQKKEQELAARRREADMEKLGAPNAQTEAQPQNAMDSEDVSEDDSEASASGDESEVSAYQYDSSEECDSDEGKHDFCRWSDLSLSFYKTFTYA